MTPELDVTTSRAKTSDELAVERTGFATRRTLMAADRTLLAWIRTALSMISFGFTIYRVLQGFEKAGGLSRPGSPRDIGLFLVGLGTVSMLAGSIEYWLTLREMERSEPVRLWRPSFVIALVLSLAGVLTFFGIVHRVL